MAEAATPATGANQEPLSVEQRMANFLVQHDEDTSSQQETEQPTAAPAEAEAQQPEGQADELTPDDLPEVQAEAQEQPAVDEFEIVHNGQQKRLSREETIRLAQQGFDYSQKMHAVAEAGKQVQQQLQRVRELEQMQQALAPDLAHVKAVEAQLAQYQNVDWVQLASENPLEYPKYRAQYDTLVNAYQNVAGQFQQKAAAIQQHRQALTAQTVQQQRAKLLEMMPSWNDQAKYEQGAKEVRDYLLKQGVDEQTIGSLNDARSVVVAWKAAQYDKLVDAKTRKVGQLKTVPPVTRPGASQGPGQAKADEFQKLQSKLKRSGSVDDAAALLFSRMK
jgi:hypothetical protein